jgi:hypothetical protein
LSVASTGRPGRQRLGLVLGDALVRELGAMELL